MTDNGGAAAVTASAWRLSFFFGAVFAVVGVVMPYWPVFLQARGLTPTQIGLVLSAVLWVRVVANPLIAQAVDRRGERRRPLLVLSAATLLGYLGFLVADGFWPLLLASLLAGVAFAAIIPLGETVVLRGVYRLGLDYGRLRLWGSVTFIAASVLGGPMLARFGPWSVLWAILALVLVVLLACALLPDERPARAARGSGPVLGLMRQPVFLLFLCTGGLIHASHAVLLGFGTLHWRSIGFSDGIIGALWAEGVIAEILLFVVSGRAVRRIGVANLLVLGAGGAVVRWTAMGLSDALWLAFVMQALHGLTFGAAHLGAMHFIARAAPDAWSATAQSLHGAVGGGIAVGLTMAAAGALYQRFDNGAYLVMAGVAALAVLAALMLARRWDGGPLVK